MDSLTPRPPISAMESHHLHSFASCGGSYAVVHGSTQTPLGTLRPCQKKGATAIFASSLKEKNPPLLHSLETSFPPIHTSWQQLVLWVSPSFLLLLWPTSSTGFPTTVTEAPADGNSPVALTDREMHIQMLPRRRSPTVPKRSKALLGVVRRIHER